MTADCDLLRDHEARFPVCTPGESPTGPSLGPPTPIVLAIELFELEEIRPLIVGSDLWKRIKQNQDERYHHLPPAPVGPDGGSTLTDLYMDFKRVVGLRPQNLYEALLTRAVQRLAIVPPVYLQDLMHRFYGFQSRVGQPD
jgi:hypothetical protein